MGHIGGRIDLATVGRVPVAVGEAFVTGESATTLDAGGCRVSPSLAGLPAGAAVRHVAREIRAHRSAAGPRTGTVGTLRIPTDPIETTPPGGTIGPRRACNRLLLAALCAALHAEWSRNTEERTKHDEEPPRHGPNRHVPSRHLRPPPHRAMHCRDALFIGTRFGPACPAPHMVDVTERSARRPSF